MSESASVKDLWGALPTEIDLHPPIALLQEQGRLLEQKTNGLLVGRTHIEKSQAGLSVAFSIVAPPINDYLYLVLSVHHGAEPYPAKVYDENAENASVRECRNADELEAAVRDVLQSPRIQRVIAGLLSLIGSAQQAADQGATA